jgi:flagellar motility protein MotE (MotC chaperone)
VNGQQLGNLHEEKARHLTMLEKEKDALRQREAEVMETIKALEQKIIAKDMKLEVEEGSVTSMLMRRRAQVLCGCSQPG